MRSDIEDFKTGWYGLTLGLRESEIDELISTLQDLKKYKTHFHLRSEFEGKGGVGDIEIYYQSEEVQDNLKLEPSCRPAEVESGKS